MGLHSVIAYYDSLSELQQEVTYLNTLGPGGVQISDWIRETILFVYKAKIFVDVIILGVRLPTVHSLIPGMAVTNQGH